MPTDTNARAISAINGLILFLGVLAASEANASVSGVVWSGLVCAAIAILSLSSLAKLAFAVGMANNFMTVTDKIASVSCALALVVFGWDALQFFRDGLAGFMAGVSIFGIVGCLFFGVWDTAKSWAGHKYHDIQSALDKGIS